MWMEIFCVHGKYLAYVARIFLKTFVLLTKVILTCLLLTTHADTIVVLLKERGEVVIPSGMFSTYKKHAFVFTLKKMKITLKKNRTMCTPLWTSVVVKYMFLMIAMVILLDEGWLVER
jgi:hypothetical protein